MDKRDNNRGKPKKRQKEENGSGAIGRRLYPDLDEELAGVNAKTERGQGGEKKIKSARKRDGGSKGTFSKHE